MGIVHLARVQLAQLHNGCITAATGNLSWPFPTKSLLLVCQLLYSFARQSVLSTIQFMRMYQLQEGIR